MQVKCTSCGAIQSILQNQNCEFCGNPIIFEAAKTNFENSKKSENGNLMAMAETAIEATNWEEALQFFNQVLTKDISNSDAWLGKGIAIVYTSKIGEIKTTEAIAYWKNAIKHAQNQDAMSKRVAKEINTVVNQFYPTIENHYKQFHEVENAYTELVNRFAILENAQDYATQIDSNNIELYYTGYNLCQKVINNPNELVKSNQLNNNINAIFGQFSSNKYTRNAAFRDSIDKNNELRKRKNEILKAGNFIIDMEIKYVNAIKRLDPNSSINYPEKQIIFEDNWWGRAKYDWNELPYIIKILYVFLLIIFIFYVFMPR